MANSHHRLNSSSSEASFKLSCDAVLSKLVPPEKSVIDSILASNDPEQPEIILPDGQHFYWYLAIGSMINPISLYLRELIPHMSYPVTCLDHRVVFRAPMGMADVEPCPGETFDGVVHLLSKEQMTRLDQMEMTYDRVKVTCIDYQGKSHTAYAYQMRIDNLPTGPPHERYLDIITKGCEYYQVRPEYINRLKEEQPVIPRKQPEHFQSFTDCPLDVYFSEEDLRKHDGSDPSLPLWVAVNGKVLEYAGLPPEDHSDYVFHRNFYGILKSKLAGREVTNVMAKALYEPLYKLPLSDDDICDEHRAQIEDHYYNTFSSSQQKSYWKPIGRLHPANNSA